MLPISPSFGASHFPAVKGITAQHDLKMLEFLLSCMLPVACWNGRSFAELG